MWGRVQREPMRASAEFIASIERAIQRARAVTDNDAIVYMVDAIPIFALYDADTAMRAAGGCPNCTYFGLWADKWHGYPSGNEAKHGIIWLFEKGIMSLEGDVDENVYNTLVHEMEHALQNDHVLDEMERQKARGSMRQGGDCGCGSA